MSDYMSVAPPQQKFNQSSAFAVAVQRAKQVSAKINLGAAPNDRQVKRPLEDALEPDAKKLASSVINNTAAAVVPPPVAAQVPSRSPPPAQANIVSAPPGLGVPPTLGGLSGPQFNDYIKVPNKMVGLIIGRGGEQITRLQAESGCKIQVAPDSGGFPERICSLSGNRDDINRAKELITNIVQQRGRTEGLGGIDLSSLPMSQNSYSGMNNSNQNMGGGGGGGGNQGPNGRNFVEIMVPGPNVGHIIGKGGETIKQLQEKSGTKMVVIQDSPNPELEKPLRISGDPNKVEYAKQLVYELIAEIEMQGYNRRGNGNGGGGGAPPGCNYPGNGRNPDDKQQYNEYGGGGGGTSEVEVLVPRPAVGVVIGKGGDMIKRIQAETDAKVQFQQAKEEGPGDRRCYLSGRTQNVDQARQRIEELIDSVCRREDGGNRGHRGGRERFDNRGNRNSNQEFSGWEDRRNQQQQQSQEVTFTVPSAKCGVIIGRGGETIKSIIQQSGAHCKLDRAWQKNTTDKSFIIRGDQEQIETAKRIISEKVQMQLNFISTGVSSNLPTAYPGMAPQGYTPQNWGAPAFPQQWAVPGQPADNTSQPANPVQVNPSTGQPDYSLQWAEYYRSQGMHREAEAIEQHAKSKGVNAPAAQPTGAPTSAPVVGLAVNNSVPPASNAKTDYSAQWAEYYRSLGKHKEAEAIESKMKAKVAQGGSQVVTTPSAGQVTPTQQSIGGVYQQSYGGYPASSGYYQGQTQGAAPPAMPQGQYGFSGYGYGGGNNSQ